MRKTATKKLVITALLLAIGYVLPLLTGNIPEIGKMLLPLHLPVLLCGLICGPFYGALLGAVLPITRSLLFTMPPLYPTATAMAFELFTYGLLTGILEHLIRKKTFFTTYLALLPAMLGGRLVWGLAMTVLLGFGEKPFTFSAFLAGGFVRAVPGIILQLVLIPLLMEALQKAHLIPLSTSEKGVSR